MATGEFAVSVEEVELDVVTPSSPSRQTEARGAGDSRLTRPSVRLGRQLSLKRKRHIAKQTNGGADGAAADADPFQRDAVRYRSLQLRPKARRSDSPPRMRRANSLTEVNRYEQWEELTVTFGDIKLSSRRLEDRIAQQ